MRLNESAMGIYLTHDVHGVARRRRVALDYVKGASLSGLCRAIVSTTLKCTTRLEQLEQLGASDI